MRDPITKLSLVTKQNCDPALYKILSGNTTSMRSASVDSAAAKAAIAASNKRSASGGSGSGKDDDGNTIVVSDAKQAPSGDHIRMNVVYYVGKVIRKMKAIVGGGSEPSILVVADQAIYLFSGTKGQMTRCIPMKSINAMIIYPESSHLVFRTAAGEYDLLLLFEPTEKGKKAEDIDFVLNILLTVFEVLYNGRKLPIEQRKTNPLDDKEGLNLKKPDLHKENMVPLTELRVPIVKTSTPIENLIRPHAPSAQSNQVPSDFQMNMQGKELSPRAEAVLKHPIFASILGNDSINNNNNDSETETEDEISARASRNLNTNLASPPSTTTSATVAAVEQEPPMPQPPGSFAAPLAASVPPAAQLAPSPHYSPNVQARGILKKDVPLTEQEEELQKKNEELTRRLKQVEALQRSVEQQQIQAIEMCDYVQRMTQTVKEASRTPPKTENEKKSAAAAANPAGLNDDSVVGGADSKNSDADGSKTPSVEDKLPSALRNVTPAPPSMLPDSFVKAVFEGNKKGETSAAVPTNAVSDLRSTSPQTASTLNAYYAMSPNRHLLHQSGITDSGSSSQILLSSRPMVVSGGNVHQQQQQQDPVSAANEAEIERRKNMMIEEAVAEVKKRMQSQPHTAPVALSPQDLQEEVLRRVRAAEDMFSSRPSHEKVILRRFHLEQRQRYLSELQQAMNNPNAKAPPPPAFSHFRFEGEPQRPYPLAVDIFITQQELLYLLRIAQAEQPPVQQQDVNNNYNPEASSWNGANENVFAAQQNYVYAAPVHHDLGGPLEPLTAAAHIMSSPEPAVASASKYHQQQPQQQRWEDLTPEQQEAARRYWANHQQPTSSSSAHHQPQQPTQPSYHHQPVQPQASPQPRQPIRAGGGVSGAPAAVVNNNNNQAIRPSPGLASYKARYGK